MCLACRKSKTTDEETLIFSTFSFFITSTHFYRIQFIFSDYFILFIHTMTSIKTINSILKICLFLLILLALVFLIRTRSHNAFQFIRTLFVSYQTQQKLSNLSSNIISKSLESFICDKTDTNRFPVSSTPSFNDSFDIYRKTTLEKYCNIVPIPRSN